MKLDTMKMIFLLVVLLVPLKVGAADQWSARDKYLETTFLAIDLMDWGLTRDVAVRDKEYHEYNPILGKHPSLDQVNAYFLATAMAHVGIVHFLPKEYRPWFQLLTIGASGYCVANNFSLGLRLRF